MSYTYTVSILILFIHCPLSGLHTKMHELLFTLVLCYELMEVFTRPRLLFLVSLTRPGVSCNQPNPHILSCAASYSFAARQCLLPKCIPLCNSAYACCSQDVQWNDIDYMDNFLDFTYSQDRFGTLPELVADLHNHGQHYIMITVSI